ncbi:MAG: TPM domain-containing protein [Bacteroidia bacterium]|nr:TPM domain-containing protein [Bacteroidia bacterium]
MKYILNRLIVPRFLLIAVLLFIFAGAKAADEFPARPEPPHLVNDFTGILSASQVRALENKLDAFNQKTSTQIAIVIVKDIFGYDKGDYAFKLAEKWGIGQKGKNNGILILVKPKFDNGETGKFFIAVGYGLEGAVPDITARKTIIAAEMMPSFKVNDYYTGLDRATTVLMSLTAGEFTADQYDEKVSKHSAFPGFAILLVIFVVFMLFNRNRNQTVGANGGGGSLLGSLWLLSMFGGRGGGGSWNDFSGGGGGDSGGFGGFGGGSFGGGGAGGEW